MNVGVLNDLAVAGVQTPGFGSGAELTIGRFVREGHQRGHVVDVINPEFCHEETLAEYDVLVTKGVTAFRRDQLEMVMKRPFVAWPSDYCWTRWRLYFAFQENHKRFESLGFWRRFFTASRFNVFLSPLHKQAYEWVMPEIGKDGVVNWVSPPPVDESQFHAGKEGHEAGTACTINGLLDFKGLYPTLTWIHEHPGVRFTSIGAIREQVNLPANAQHIGRVPWKRLREILARTELYVELPSSAQPFNQSAVQGFLSCKRVVTNELLGAASFDWFKKGDRDAGREAVRKAIPTLWNLVEKVET